MQNNTIYILGIIFILSLVISFFLHRFFLLKSEKYKIKKANNSAIRWRTQNKPISGGFTFYSIFIIIVLATFICPIFDISQNKALTVITIATTISFLMGMSDDIIDTSPIFKFIVQFIAAILLINFDVYIKISPNNFYNYSLTIFWVVGIMNSINMLDNMDSITALISISILSNIFISSLFADSFNIYISAIVIGVIASLITFIKFNWFNAKMYMGDNGSQFLGILLASLGIIYIWNSNVTDSYGYNSQQFIAVIMAFIIPLTDTTTVTINRLLKGKSPFIGGKDHTTHFLTYLGLHEKKAVLLLFTISLIFNALSVYTINFIDKFTDFYFYLFGFSSLLVFLLLYLNTKITKEK